MTQTPTNAPQNNSGLALINALLVITALMSVAVLLLNTSQSARIRQAAIQDVTQAQAYLDSFESLIRLQLDADRARGPVDHLGEGWAIPNYTVAIGRGQANARIVDLQGRFPLSELSGGDAVFGQETFVQLMANLGQPNSLTEAILQWLSQDGPPNRTPYLGATPPLAPRGGPLTLLNELRQVKGMTPVRFEKLSDVLSAVSSEGALNINTAPDAVLSAALHKIPSGTLAALFAQRRDTPFETDEDLDLWLQNSLSEDDYQNFALGRFIVSSRWFKADLSVTLGKTRLSRQVIFQRTGETGQAKVKFRTQPNGS